MASPTPPTRTTLITEAWNILKASPSPTDISLAETHMEVMKSELSLFLPGGRLKSLLQRSTLIVAQGRSTYPMPSDIGFYGDIGLGLITGTVTGTATAGTLSSITLADGDTVTVGQWILIVGGTGKGSMSQCTSLSGQVASCIPNFSVILDNTSVYLIITTSTVLKPRNIALYSFETEPGVQDVPKYYYPFEGTTNGQMILAPTPDKVYGISYMFNINLQTLDLAESGTLISTLYDKLHAFWYHGLLAWVYEKENDPRAAAQREYYNTVVLPAAVTQEAIGSH
jgi:hypothetical protein